MDIFLRVLKWSAAAGAAVLAAAVGKPMLDRRYSPKWRYGVWLVLAAALVLSPVPWGTLLPAAEPLVTVEVPRVEAAVGGGGLQLRQPVTVPALGAPLETPAEQTEPLPPELTLEEPGRVLALPLDTLLPAVWLAGAAVFTLWHLVGTVWFSRRARRWALAPDRETVAVYDQVRGDMGLRRAPRLLVSAAVGSPMVLGLLRPGLLLPDRAFGERELTFILRHELTHYRRGDLWYKLAVLTANAIHWFNPLVWLLRREAGETLELLCDEAAVAGADREARQVYCETLLAAVHRQEGLDRAALSTHFYGGAKVMRRRFQNLLGSRGRKSGWAALAAMLAVTLLGACAVGIRQKPWGEPAAEAMSEEEIAQWQERLESVEWNGFVTCMYSDVRRLPLRELLYNGAGISREMTEEERAAYEADTGMVVETDAFALDRAAVEAYLLEHTGYAPEDFSSGLAEFIVLPGEYDSVYLIHGDTNYTGVEVTGGTKNGDTLALEVHSGSVNGNFGVLTVRDGKVVSFTNDQYTAVEDLAWERMDRVAAAVDAQGAWEVTARTLTLYPFEVYPREERTYCLYFMYYSLWLEQTANRRVLLDLADPWIELDLDGQTVWLAGHGSGLVREYGMMDPVLAVSVDEAGKVRLERYLTGGEAEVWAGRWETLVDQLSDGGPAGAENLGT